MEIKQMMADQNNTRKMNAKEIMEMILNKEEF